MKILQKKENPLFSRTSLKVEVEHKGKPTPTNADIKKRVAELMKVDEKLVVIEHIYTKFSAGVSEVIAHVYKNEKALENVKIKKKKKKEAKKEEAKSE
jgi:ribosomal protein S24E